MTSSTAPLFSPKRAKQPNHQLQQSPANSKKIELPFSLVESGRAIQPPNGDYSTLLKLIPTTFAVEVRPPFLIVRVRELPPKPWPFTIGDLPIHISTHDHGERFRRGSMGRGKEALPNLSLRKRTPFTLNVLEEAIRYFETVKVRIRDIYWFAGFWLVTTLDKVDPKLLPALIAGSPTWYRTAAEHPDPDPAALRKPPPRDLEVDDSDYARTTAPVLRPGIMLSSSAQAVVRDGQISECWKTTTSGILVANSAGEVFITVSAHGFESDGLVWHPNPKSGRVIGKIETRLPYTDIALAKLSPGLRYINETFGTATEPNNGTKINGIVPADYQPHLRTYDPVNTNNPFSSGHCIGTVLATGARITGDQNKPYVLHEWHAFEKKGDQTTTVDDDGSCGSAVLDNKEGRVVGLLLRFKQQEEGSAAECVCIAAIELVECGYEVFRGGLHTF